MKKSGVYVLLLLLLLVVAVVLSVSQLKKMGEPAPEASGAPVSESPTPSAAPSAAPSPSPEASPSPEPTPDPTPVPEPTPTPEATPSPTPAQTVLGQGSFASDTGTALNLLVTWTATASGADSASLLLEISTQSYSFFTSALPGSLTLTVNGESYVLDSPEIAYDGTEPVTTLLASRTVTIPLDTQGKAAAEIRVLWNYRGSYGGTELETISAAGTAAIG